MASQSKIEGIQKRIEVCQEYAHLWSELFKTFGTGGFHERKILDQDEVRFRKLVTELAKQHFRFGFYMAERFSDGDKILDILERLQDLRTVQEMSDANFNKLEVDWHTIFINMHRAVGRLMREMPPEEPEEEDNGGKKKKKGKGLAAPRAGSGTGVSSASPPPSPKMGPPGGGPPRMGPPQPGSSMPGPPKPGPPKMPPPKGP